MRATRSNLCGVVSSAAMAVCLPLVTSAASDSTPDSEVLDQIVVVAHKAARSVRDVAANVTVVSRADIDANLAASMSEAFRYLPGIDYEAAGSRFGSEGLNIRGIGGNRVAMLIDGVPLSDQFDVGSYSNATRDFINAGLIKDAEILHGPSSALYGSAAIGGVLAARTPDPHDIAPDGATGGRLNAMWRGADNSAHVNGLFAINHDATGLLFGGSVRSGDQVQSAAVQRQTDIQNYERRSALVKLVTDDSRGNTWQALAIQQTADVSSDLHSMLGSGRYRTSSALTGNDGYDMDLLAATMHFGDPESLIEAGYVRAYYQRANIFQRTLDVRALATQPVSIERDFSFEQAIHGVELNLQKSHDWHGVQHLFALGAEFRERHTAEYRDGTSTGILDGIASKNILGEVFPLRDFPLSQSREWGVYLEDTMRIGDFTLIAALRADRFSLRPESDAMYAEDYPFATPVSINEADLSPKLGLVYRLTDAAEVYVQYAHGFRAPPYAEANIGLEIPFFNYRAVPNPDLRSETSDGLDIGLRWQSDAAAFHVSAFHTRYSDFIASKVRIGTDPLSGRVLFQSQNISQTVIEGIELGGSARFTRWDQDFSVDASLYKARGENRDNGMPLNSVGPAQAVAALNWTSPGRLHGLRLQALITDNWDSRDESGGTLYKPTAYTVVDLYYRFKLSDSIVMRAGVRNLGDRVYWNWAGVRGLSDGDAVIPYLAEPGRNLSISMNYQWQ